jgi:Short C-terminal domain
MEAKVRLRVMPEGQQGFDSEARVWGMDAVQQLAPGRDTYVLYDPEHPSHCDIDRDRLRNEFGPGRTGKDRVVISTDAQAQFEQQLTARERNPGAYADDRRAMMDRAAAAKAHAQAITEALQAGDFTEVERLKALLAAGGPSASSGPGSVHPGAAGPEDPLERLQKLADLHDRGALTDAEFAAEKAKILNQS